MTTAAVVGVAGKHLVHTLLHPPIDVADRSKLFPEQAISQFNTVGRHRVVCAKSTSHSSKTSYTGRQRQTLKALKDANASSASPSATSAVLEEDEHAQLQQTMEALLLLQKSLLEKQWTLPFDMDDDSRETKSTDSPETAEIVWSKRPSARSRRLASRKNSSICSLKSEIAERISKKNKGTLLSAAFPGQFSKSSRSRLSLLTPEEVIWLSKKIQAGIQLKNIRSRLKAKLGFEPTKAQWAASVNMSLVELNATLMEYSTAKEKLKMSNIRLVLSIARKYENLGLEMGDLIREGLSGLARGIEKFDASKGYKLSTYVYWWIRQSITKALTEHSKVTPVPRHLQKRLKLILSAKEELKSKGIVPSTQSIAKFLNMSTSMVKNAKKANKTVISLDREAYRGSQGSGPTLHNIIADDNLEEQPWFKIEENALREDVISLINSTLNKREQIITKLYYGLDTECQTWEDISKQLGLSRERVRQIGLVSLEKLKQTVRDDNADPITIP